MSTLANVRQVLDLIARLRRDVTMTDLVSELAMEKSSASRTLTKMAQHCLLERDPITRAYRPGRVVMAASYHFHATYSARSLLEASLDELVVETGYTGYLNVLDKAETLVVAMRAGGTGLQLYTPSGTRAPAYASSPGRAMLARLSDAEAIACVQFDIRRGHVPRSKKELVARLEIVRKTGWSLSRGEYVDGVAGVSAAVRDPTTREVYAIGLALPSHDLSQRAIERLGMKMRNVAHDVGNKIGDPYWLNFGRPKTTIMTPPS
jgi:DNA-binding IclR family transcriptional regulator